MPIDYLSICHHEHEKLYNKPMFIIDLDRTLWKAKWLTPGQQLLQGKRFAVEFLPHTPKVFAQARKAKNAGFTLVICTTGPWTAEAFIREVNHHFSALEAKIFDDAIFVNRHIAMWSRSLAKEFVTSIFNGEGVKGSLLLKLFKLSDHAQKNSILFDDSAEQRANAEEVGMQAVDSTAADCVATLRQKIQSYADVHGPTLAAVGANTTTPSYRATSSANNQQQPHNDRRRRQREDDDEVTSNMPQPKTMKKRHGQQ